MQIAWHGLSCFTISGKPVLHEVAIVLNPYDGAEGLRLPKTLSGAIVATTHDDKLANYLEGVAGVEEKKKPFVVSHAGEYEVQGIFVRGVSAPLKDGTAHTIYVVSIERIRVAHLGALDRSLTDDEAQALGEIDVLIVPAGGNGALNAEGAAEAVAQIEPRIVVPSFIGSTGYGDADSVARELGLPKEESNKLTLKKGALPEDETKLVILAKS